MEKEIYSYDQAFENTLKYFNGDELAAKVWCNKYALKDSFGNIYEKSPEDMHHRIASELARIENNYSNPMSESELFGLMDHFRYIVPQGSPMTGIGNNFQIASLSNCFVIGVEGASDSYGAIIKMGTHVKGLTTAASIWGAAGIGLALGAGLYGPGILTLVIMLFFLHILFPLGKKIFPPKWHARLELEYKGKFPKKEVIDKVFESFKLKNQCKETKVNRSKENISEIKVYELDGKGIFDTEELIKAFRQKGDLQCFRLTDTGND